MGMFSSDDQPRRMIAGIDLTPMVGVLAALLVLFVSFPMAVRSVPKPAIGEPGFCNLGASEPIELSIDALGETYLDGKSVSRKDLTRRVQELAGSESGPWITLIPGPHTKFQQIVSVLEIFEQRDFHKFEFSNRSN